jgi:UDP-N-acetylmuramate dehydrogenase
MTITEQLQAILGNRLKENLPMSQHTNFRIGGPARWFCEVRTIEQIKQVLLIAHQNDLKHFVFGGGSNLLVNDVGFDGIVIKIAMRAYEIHDTTVRAEAGVLSAALARATANTGLKGLTWMISLPGTIGGAVRGNAGCFGGEAKDLLTMAEVLVDGELVELSKDQLAFAYRESSIKHSDKIVLAATFELTEGDAAELKSELDDNLLRRKTTQPRDAGSAGCLFKNYEIKSDEELQRLRDKLDIPSEMSSSRQISAGWLIDQLDLKGTMVGGAQISEIHGNFVVNTGEATADHVVQLISLIKTKARDQLGVTLEEEVQYIGF